MVKTGDTPKGWSIVVLASLVVVVGALYYAREVLIPLALAILVSYLLEPLASRLERLYLGRVISVLLVVATALLVVASIGWLLESQFIQIANKLPHYRAEIHRKVSALHFEKQGVGEAAIKVVRTVQEIAQPAATRPATSPTRPAHRAAPAPSAAATRPTSPLPQVSPTNPLPVRQYPESPSPVYAMFEIVERLFHPLTTAGLVVVFVIFILLTRENLRDRIIRLASRGRLNFTIQIVEESTRRISHFLLALSVVNTFYGLAVISGLSIIGHFLGRHEGGFPNVLLWGLLSAVLRFIPYIGAWIAAAFPLILAFGIFPGYGVFLAVLLLFVGLELLVSQFIEPMLYGSVTGISTMAILVAAVFWSFVWGLTGLLLSTPMTVVLAIVGKYVPQLQFLNVLLGDEPVLEPPERVYQRLVAFDHEEALELAQEYLESASVEELFDHVLIPALLMAELDHRRGTLDDHRQHAVHEGLRQIIEEVQEQQKEERGPGPAGETRQVYFVVPPDRTVNVLCLPAHEEADEIVCLMLAQLLQPRGYHVRISPATSLAGEKSAMVEEHQADIVCVSAVPPEAVTRARVLCKWLLGKCPQLNLIVGLWGVKTDAGRILRRLALVEKDRIATTLAQAQSQIDRLARIRLLAK